MIPVLTVVTNVNLYMATISCDISIWNASVIKTHTVMILCIFTFQKLNAEHWRFGTLSIEKTFSKGKIQYCSKKKRHLKWHLTVHRFIIQCFLGNDLQGFESYIELTFPFFFFACFRLHLYSNNACLFSQLGFFCCCATVYLRTAILYFWPLVGTLVSAKKIKINQSDAYILTRPCNEPCGTKWQ